MTDIDIELSSSIKICTANTFLWRRIKSKYQKFDLILLFSEIVREKKIGDSLRKWEIQRIVDDLIFIMKVSCS